MLSAERTVDCSPPVAVSGASERKVKDRELPLFPFLVVDLPCLPHFFPVASHHKLPGLRVGAGRRPARGFEDEVQLSFADFAGFVNANASSLLNDFEKFFAVHSRHSVLSA